MTLPSVSNSVFHDPWLTSKGPTLANLADTIAQDIESSTTGRKRKDAIKRRHLATSNLIANLANLVLAPNYTQGQRLAVSTSWSKPTRYRHPSFPTNLLTAAITEMEKRGLIIKHPYQFKKRTTTIEPTSSLEEVLRSTIKPDDLSRDVGTELIRLSARTGYKATQGEPLPKTQVQYNDTSESNKFRGEVEAINAYLNHAGITFDGQQTVPIILHRCFTLRQEDDTPAFNLGGRLYGGFWMNLPSCDRCMVRLDGEEIADLDFSAMFANLAYLQAGESIPNESPYAIQGLENHRDGAKQAMLSLLSRPSDMKRLSSELKALLPNGWTAKSLQNSVGECHPKIAHLFGTDIAIELMFTESRILVALLLKLAALGIPALPMHDGVMVPKGKTAEVIKAMSEASMEVVGAAIPVVEKPIIRTPKR